MDTVNQYIDRIRAAYRRVIAQQGKRPGDWVMLTDLRPDVGGHRPHVDAALVRMGRGDYRGPRGYNDVSIVPESNQKTLTAYDRAAAVRIGNQDNHLIAIEGP